MTDASFATNQLEANIKLLALVKRSAYLLADLPHDLQSPQIRAHRANLVDAIKLHDPEYYGL